MDLLDLLIEPDAPSHMLMPNMALACGRDLLTNRQPWTTSSAEATCPACLEVAEAHGGLHAWCEAMQGRQARVKD